MSTLRFRAVCLAVSIGAALTVPHAHAQVGGPPRVKAYDVFVDLPTAFAFVKIPTGWKFIGRLDADQLRDLPPGTLTSLLPADEAEVQLTSDAGIVAPRAAKD